MANPSKEIAIHHFPHFPRPHRPHGDNLILAGLAIVGFGLAGVTLGVTKDAVDRIQPRTDSFPRPGAVEPEAMRFPVGEYINLTIGSTGEVVMEFTQEPKPLKAMSFNATSFEIDEGGLVYFRNDDPNNPQVFEISPDSLRNDNFVPVFVEGDKYFSQVLDNIPRGDISPTRLNGNGERLSSNEIILDNIPRGDIWLMRTNENGERLGQNGQILLPGESPILTRIDWVNLAIPFQLPAQA